MTTTRQPSAADKRAEAIFNKAKREACEYINRISHAPMSQVAIEARQGFEIGVLHSEIRQLCYKIEELKAASWAQGERIEQLQFEAAKGDDDGDDEPARFTANDAADAAVWGV